jgi:hypothetical protein
MAVEWETKFKPMILACRIVPLSLVAAVLDCSIDKVQTMLRSGKVNFGVANEGKYSYGYDVYPLRFIAWYEGKMT